MSQRAPTKPGRQIQCPSSSHWADWEPSGSQSQATLQLVGGVVAERRQIPNTSYIPRYLNTEPRSMPFSRKMDIVCISQAMQLATSKSSRLKEHLTFTARRPEAKEIDLAAVAVLTRDTWLALTLTTDYVTVAVCGTNCTAVTPVETILGFKIHN